MLIASLALSTTLPIASFRVRTVYTLLPRGYLERHGGKAQRAGAGGSVHRKVGASGDEADSGDGVAADDSDDEGSVGEVEAVLSSDRASRWLLSSDEASDDIAFMRVSCLLWFSRGEGGSIACCRLH